MAKRPSSRRSVNNRLPHRASSPRPTGKQPKQWESGRADLRPSTGPIHVRERLQLLFINVQEDAPLERLGLPPYREWIANAAGVRLDQVTVVRVADGEPLPSTIEQHGIIGGGSGHSTTERLPWIEETREFFRIAERLNVPQFHICFSHQAKAESVGGTCGLGQAGRRFGIEQLTLTPAGRKDPLFADLPDSFELFTSHQDAVHEIPASAASGAITELAYSPFYRHESFAIGNATRTFQAHPEVTADVIVALATARRKALIDEGLLGDSPEEFEEFVTGVRRREPSIRATGNTIMRNWVHHYAARAEHRVIV
jgi:GMP synthase (glutamine-hydrolysing)